MPSSASHVSGCSPCRPEATGPVERVRKGSGGHGFGSLASRGAVHGDPSARSPHAPRSTLLQQVVNAVSVYHAAASEPPSTRARRLWGASLVGAARDTLWRPGVPGEPPSSRAAQLAGWPAAQRPQPDGKQPHTEGARHSSNRHPRAMPAHCEPSGAAASRHALLHWFCTALIPPAAVRGHPEAGSKRPVSSALRLLTTSAALDTAGWRQPPHVRKAAAATPGAGSAALVESWRAGAARPLCHCVRV